MTYVFTRQLSTGENLMYVYDNEGSNVEGTRHFVTCRQYTAARGVVIDNYSIGGISLGVATIEWVRSHLRRILAHETSGRPL